MIPRHRLGIRLLTGFARFDEFLGNGGQRNIAQSFVVDSLGASQIPQLGTSEAAIRSLSGSASFHVNAGQIVAAANSRVVTAPLMLEYGLSSRLTLGVVIPLVETRSTVFAQPNPKPGTANVGLNPGQNAWATNAQLVTAMRTAATTLTTRLTTCRAAPTGAGCDALLAQQSAAQALIDATAPLASGIETLYGTGTATPGLTFVPIKASAEQTVVNARVANLRASYQTFGANIPDVALGAAAGPIARTDLQTILGAAGYDSLRTTNDRSSIGDITIGATYQLGNSFSDSGRAVMGMPYRFAVNAGFRIGTGEPANRNRLFDNPTGYGQPGIIVGAATDVRLRPRLFVTAVGSYTKQIGSVEVARVSNSANAVLPLILASPTTYSAGDEIVATVIPHYRLGGLFSVDGIYSLRHTGAETYTVSASTPETGSRTIGSTVATAPYGIDAGTAHQVGMGFSYSSALNDRGPGRLPYEASFRHVETIAGSGGPVAKTFVEQVQLRVFFR